MAPEWCSNRSNLEGDNTRRQDKSGDGRGSTGLPVIGQILIGPWEIRLTSQSKSRKQKESQH